jgi:hypothetical protein
MRPSYEIEVAEQFMRLSLSYHLFDVAARRIGLTANYIPVSPLFRRHSHQPRRFSIQSTRTLPKIDVRYVNA